MKSILRQSAIMLLLFSGLTGIFYPVFVTIVAQNVFPRQANGSLIVQGNRVIGSELIGQSFEDPKYFWGRPSSTPQYSYNAAASNASNLGPTNPALRDAVAARIAALRKVDPDNRELVPVDLVTSSASGLDPHISVAAAYFQSARVARLRGLDPARIRALVQAHIEPSVWSLLGENKVNVLRLNLALDAITKSGP